MSSYTNKLGYILILVFMLMGSSCVDYLDKTLEADVTEKDVFSTFYNYQGFVETAYAQIINFQRTPNNNPNWNFGDDVLLSNPRYIQNGDYWNVTNAPGLMGSAYMIPESVVIYDAGETTKRCVWFNSWHGIRIANIALEHMDDLEDATDEERNVIQGQAYFFRGYFHWEIMKVWGSIPYVDKVLSPTDEMKISQLKFSETADKVISDLQKAADLLPVDWNQSVVGQLTYGRNIGRLTKGMALAMLTQIQLFTGSPLMNGVSSGDYSYNTGYCKDAAATAWKVIELAKQGVYNLEPFATYETMFRSKAQIEPGINKEVIFMAPFYGNYSKYFIQGHLLPSLGGSNGFASVTENAVEWFETKDGWAIDDPNSEFDSTDPWSNRDPRFYYNILIDNERIVQNRDDEVAFAQLYVGGRDRQATASQTGFGIKKFHFLHDNKYDNGWGSNQYAVLPIIRMSEVYLYYAEAVNEAYGPMGKVPGADMTAVDAVNIVRTRAGMPNVHDKYTASKENFRERIRNERAVELIFEGKRRDDIRRWHVAAQDKYKDLYGCTFPKDHSYFSKEYVKSIIFEEKHYWFPFPTNQVSLYDGWKQNPGW